MGTRRRSDIIKTSLTGRRKGYVHYDGCVLGTAGGKAALPTDDHDRRYLMVLTGFPPTWMGTCRRSDIIKTTLRGRRKGYVHHDGCILGAAGSQASLPVDDYDRGCISIETASCRKEELFMTTALLLKLGFRIITTTVGFVFGMHNFVY